MDAHSPFAARFFQFLKCSAVLLLFLTQAAQATLTGSYLPAWSTEKGFRIKDLDSSGVAAHFSYFNYAFENLYDMGDGTYRCDSGRDIEDQGDGG